MADPRELLEQYGEDKRPSLWVDAFGYALPLRDHAPRTFAALRAVLYIHERVVGLCGACREEPWPCPTVRAITEALEGETDAE